MYKFLILTESAGNPRTFPASEIVQLEETYPYLLRKEFADSMFYQLSFGNLETEKILNQAISFLTSWRPDFIIVHSGLNDCRPEAFSELQKNLILKFFIFLPFMRKILYNPKLIKFRQVYRVTKSSFKKDVKKFLSIFNNSKILWLEIIAKSNYEERRPGVNKRIIEYNKILKDLLQDNLIPIKDKVEKVNGFNNDRIHWNKFGHQAVTEQILLKIKEIDQS